MSKGARGCYAVARGHRPGIYLEWKECEAQVLNFNGAKYKKFHSAADAELWIHQNTDPHVQVLKTGPTATTTDTSSPALSPVPGSVSPPSHASSDIIAPRVQTIVSSSGAIRSPTREKVPVPRAPIATRGARPPSPPLVSTITSVTTNANAIPQSIGPLIVYTDGSCRGNGKVGSSAGVGVWWGDNDPRNVCERCPGSQTNNRAELIAIIRVLETAAKDRLLIIKSDSEYSMNAMIKWVPGWKVRGWRKADGKLILNLSLIKYADILLEERRRSFDQAVEFVKVKAHVGHKGNEEADRLANEGATLPEVPECDWDCLFEEVKLRMSISLSPVEGVVATPRFVSEVPKQPASLPQPNAISPVQTVQNPRTTAATSADPRVRADQAVIPPLKAASVQDSPHPMTAQSTVSSEVYGRTDIRISEKELEMYAACLLEDDALIREAREEGICT